MRQPLTESHISAIRKPPLKQGVRGRRSARQQQLALRLPGVLLSAFRLGDNLPLTERPGPAGAQQKPGNARNSLPCLSSHSLPCSLKVTFPGLLLPAFHCFSALMVSSCVTSCQVWLHMFRTWKKTVNLNLFFLKS